MAPAPFSFPTLLEPYERPSDIARRPVTNSAGEDLPDDLSRKAYCILGMPIDAIEMPAVVREIRSAAEHGVRFLLSTPNLNFLVNCQQDPEFRESVLLSDLCPADGMPIVWIARLMGLPIKERIAGSDIFVALQAKQPSDRALQIFLFGGAEGVAEAAARSLNAEPLGMVCVGALDPGIGTVEEISQNEYIDAINLSGADFLAVSLGAKKGQLWLLRNHQRLRVPVRVHLGATINFQAGTVRRAPPRLRRWGGGVVVAH